MQDGPDPTTNDQFRLTSGAVIRAGWLRRDLHFLTRSLRFLLRPESEGLRTGSGLEAGDIGVLAVVMLNPGITQNDLAASLVLKKSAVTRVVQRLEKRGLLMRERSKTDRRANHLSLTPGGERLAVDLREATQQQHAEWLRGIAPEDADIFFDVLFRVVANLAESRPEGALHDDGD